MEANDLAMAFATLGGSDEPFDQWFRDHVRKVHGFSLEDGIQAPELILDYREDSPAASEHPGNPDAPETAARLPLFHERHLGAKAQGPAQRGQQVPPCGQRDA